MDDNQPEPGGNSGNKKFSIVFWIVAILVSAGTAAGIIIGANFFGFMHTTGLQGGAAQGSNYSARHYMTFNSGSQNASGSLYSANIGLFGDVITTLDTIKIYGASLTIPESKSIIPNSSAVYIITITNNGTAQDSYNLALTNVNSADTAISSTNSISNLAQHASTQLTLTVGSTNAGNYLVLLRATSQGNASVYHEIPVLTTISNAVISSAIVNPYAAVNGSNVTLLLSTLNAQSAWANITQPDGVVEVITLQNGIARNYTNTSKLGKYNVIFYANDSSGFSASKSDFFETFEKSGLAVNITDFNLSLINVSWSIIYREQQLANSSSNGIINQSIANSLINLEVRAYNEKIQTLLKGMNITKENNKVFGVDKLPSPNTGHLLIYAIENNFTFSNATVRVFYDDSSYRDEDSLKIEKCNSWNFTGRFCYGNWSDVTSSSIKNKASKYFEYVTSSFSGFGIKQGSFCGDGICASGESCGSCSADCGSCPTSAASSPATAQGGGGCLTGWACSAWGECKNGIQTRTCLPENPICYAEPAKKPAESQSCVAPITEEKIAEQPAAQERLFDIAFELDSNRVRSSRELSARVSFRAVRPVESKKTILLKYAVLQETSTVYSEQESVDVSADQTYTTRFESLSLNPGKYTLMLRVLQEGNIQDEFTREFEVAAAPPITGFAALVQNAASAGILYALLALTASILLGYFIFKYKRKHSKAINEEKSMKK